MVENTAYKIIFSGTGARTQFDFTTFAVYSADHLKVYLDGVSQTTGYAVTLTDTDAVARGEPSRGYVTFTAAPELGLSVVLKPVPPKTQLVNHIDNESTPAATINRALDLAVQNIQDLQEQLERTVRGSVDDTALPDYAAFTAAVAEATAAAALATAAAAAVGVDARSYSSINAAVAAIGATETTLIVSDAQTLEASLIIPATLTLKINRGGSIVKAAAYTLTINGSLEAGLYAIFSGFSSSDIIFAYGSVDAVCPEWWGAVGDASTDDYTALAAMIGSIASYTTVKLSGIYAIGTTLAVNKVINFLGTGLGSGFYLTMGVGSNGITYGNTESGASAIKHSTWSNFGIYGAALSCLNALVLTGMVQNIFDNIHVMAGTAATGYGVWARWCQSCHRMNFIMGQFYNQYPVTCSGPANGFKSTSIAGIDSVFHDNVLDVVVEGMTGKGIYIYGGIASTITGLSEGNTDYSLHLKDCSCFRVSDFYSETASDTANENEIYIEGGSFNILGPGVFSAPGGPNNIDVKISGATDTKVDGLFCSVLSIDATCVDTKIGQVATTGQTGSGIQDLGINTSQVNASAFGYLGFNDTGLFSDFSSILTNGSFERWVDANTPAGAYWDFVDATATRETTIIQHGIASCKVEITGGTSAKVARLSIPAGLITSNPAGKVTVTGWVYIPTATGKDITLAMYRDSDPHKGITISSRDVWTKVSFNMDNTEDSAHTALYLYFYNAEASDATFYLDGFSVVPGVAGGASWFTPNANEFPKYTGNAVWDPASIAASGYLAKDFTVLGAGLGMAAKVGAGVDVTDLMVSATVTAANTVTVVLFNPTVGAIDLASSTWYVSVEDVTK